MEVCRNLHGKIEFLEVISSQSGIRILWGYSKFVHRSCFKRHVRQFPCSLFQNWYPNRTFCRTKCNHIENDISKYMQYEYLNRVDYIQHRNLPYEPFLRILTISLKRLRFSTSMPISNVRTFIENAEIWVF